MCLARKCGALGCLLALLCLPLGGQPARRGTLEITELGLKGFYLHEDLPTRIQFRYQGPESSGLRLRVQIYDERTGPELGHTFEFSAPPLRNGTFDVPILIPHQQRPRMTAEVLDGNEQVVARASKPVEPPLDGQLIGIICEEDSVCQAGRTAAGFSGSYEEKTQKEKSLRFVEIRQLPEIAYAYSAVHTLIVASSFRSASAQGLHAVEGYLRGGGSVILSEAHVTDRTWLAAYRTGAPTAQWRAVGMGRLYRAKGIGTEELGKLFRGEPLQRLVYSERLNGELPWARRRLATTLNFPTFPWLVIWLIAYMVVAGPVNFLLLRKKRRPEWAWVTTPSLAVLFAIALYVSSVTSRPNRLSLDAITLLWMDDRSPMGFAETGVRITSPSRLQSVLRVRGGEFAGSGQAWPYMDFSSVMTAAVAGELGGMKVYTEMDGGNVFPLRMLPWSFRDMLFRGVHPLPGTVQRTEAGALRNATGLDFREAIYVNDKKVHLLGTLARDAEVRLEDSKTESLESSTGWNASDMFSGLPNRLAETNDETNRPTDPSDIIKNQERLQAMIQGPFSLLELIRGWPKGGGRAFAAREALFLGLAEAEVVAAGLEQPIVSRKNFVVVIVSLAEKP